MEVENENCPCIKDCPRHGRCSECRTHHGEHGGLTCCEKEERYRRSSWMGKILYSLKLRSLD